MRQPQGTRRAFLLSALLPVFLVACGPPLATGESLEPFCPQDIGHDGVRGATADLARIAAEREGAREIVDAEAEVYADACPRFFNATVRWLTQDILETPEYMPTIDRILAIMQERSAAARAADRARGTVLVGTAFFAIALLLCHFMTSLCGCGLRRARVVACATQFTMRPAVAAATITLLLVASAGFAAWRSKDARLAPFAGVSAQHDALLNRIGFEIVAQKTLVHSMLAIPGCPEGFDFDAFAQRLTRNVVTLSYLDGLKQASSPVFDPYSLPQFYLSDIVKIAETLDQLRFRCSP